jgi:hypothetical protein
MSIHPLRDADDPSVETHCDARPRGITPERAITLADTHREHDPAHCAVWAAAMATLAPSIPSNGAWQVDISGGEDNWPDTDVLPHRVPGAARQREQARIQAR